MTEDCPLATECDVLPNNQHSTRRQIIRINMTDYTMKCRTNFWNTRIKL